MTYQVDGEHLSRTPTSQQQRQWWWQTKTLEDGRRHLQHRHQLRQIRQRPVEDSGQGQIRLTIHGARERREFEEGAMKR